MTDAHSAEPETPSRRAGAVNNGNPPARRKWLLILAIVVVLAAIIYGVYLFFQAPSEETDDAYVAGDTVTITARDPGNVLALYADNTQMVRAGQPLADLDRSEEHTSELQSLMRISYAVFCLKNKKNVIDT